VSGTTAVNCVLETKVVVSGLPFHTTWLPVTKPVPLAVSVIAGLPLKAVFGSIDVSVGGVPVEAPVTVNGREFVVFLVASCTATLIAPAAATFAAGITPCNCVAESKVVVIAVPLSVITSPLAKPTPVADKVKSGLPAATDDGEIDVRLNVCKPVPVIVNNLESEVVVSDFITRILTEPAAAICSAVIEAVNWVLETTEVESAIPSQRICVPLVKFVPVAVSVKPSLPAATVAGEMAVNVGVTTPLKPPHPERTVTTSNKPDRTIDRDTRILIFGLSGKSVVQTWCIQP